MAIFPSNPYAHVEDQKFQGESFIAPPSNSSADAKDQEQSRADREAEFFKGVRKQPEPLSGVASEDDTDALERAQRDIARSGQTASRLDTATGAFAGGVASGVGGFAQWVSSGWQQLFEASANLAYGLPVLERGGVSQDPLDWDTGNIVFQLGEGLQLMAEEIPSSPEYEGEVWAGIIPQAAGSVVGMMLGSKGVPIPKGAMTRLTRRTQRRPASFQGEAFKQGRVIKSPVGPALAPSKAIGPVQANLAMRGLTDQAARFAGAGAGMGGMEGFYDARRVMINKALEEGRDHLTEEEMDKAWESLAWNAPMGALEIVGAAGGGLKLMKWLDKATKGSWGNMTAKYWRDVAKGAGKGAAWEIGQENTQNAWLNYGATTIAAYDEGRSLWQGAREATIGGGAIGGLMGGLANAASRRGRLHRRLRELRAAAYKLRKSGSVESAKEMEKKGDEIESILLEDLYGPPRDVTFEEAFPKSSSAEVAKSEVSNRVTWDLTDPNNPVMIVEADATVTSEEVQEAEKSLRVAANTVNSNQLTYDLTDPNNPVITDSEGSEVSIEEGTQPVSTPIKSITYNGIQIQDTNADINSEETKSVIQRVAPMIEEAVVSLGMDPSAITIKANKGGGGLSVEASDHTVVNVDVDWLQDVASKMKTSDFNEYLGRAIDEEARHIAIEDSMMSDFVEGGGKETDTKGFLEYREGRLKSVYNEMTDEERKAIRSRRGTRGAVESDAQLANEFVRHTWQQIATGKITEDYLNNRGAIRGAIEAVLRYFKRLTGTGLNPTVLSEIETVEKFLKGKKPSKPKRGKAAATETKEQPVSIDEAADAADAMLDAQEEQAKEEQAEVKPKPAPKAAKGEVDIEALNKKINEMSQQAAGSNAGIPKSLKEEAANHIREKLLAKAMDGDFDNLTEEEAGKRINRISGFAAVDFIRKEMGRSKDGGIGKRGLAAQGGSLDEATGEGTQTKGDILQDEEQQSPDDQAAAADKVRMVREAIASLDEEHRGIIQDALDHGGARNPNPKKGEKGTTAKEAASRLGLSIQQYKTARARADKAFLDAMNKLTGTKDHHQWAFNPLDALEEAVYDIDSGIQRDSISGARTAILGASEHPEMVAAGMGEARIPTNGADFTDVQRRLQSAIFQSVRLLGDSLGNFYGVDSRKASGLSWALLNNRNGQLKPRRMENGTMVEVSPDLIRQVEKLREMLPSIPESEFTNLEALGGGAEADVYLDRDNQAVYKVINAERDGGLGRGAPIGKFIEETRPEFMPSYQQHREYTDIHTFSDIAERFRIQNNHGGFVFTEMVGTVEKKGLVVKQRFINGTEGRLDEEKANAERAGLLNMSPTKVDEKYGIPDSAGNITAFAETFIHVDGERAFAHGDLTGSGNIFIGEMDGEPYLIDVMSKELSSEEMGITEIKNDIERASRAKNKGQRQFAFDPLDKYTPETKVEEKAFARADKNKSRNPRLAVAAVRMANDEITVQEYRRLVEESGEGWAVKSDKAKKMRSEGWLWVKKFLGVPNRKQIQDHLPKKEDGFKRIMLHDKNWGEVEVRIDIPTFNSSLKKTGEPVYAVTIHSKGMKAVQAWTDVARVKNFETVIRQVHVEGEGKVKPIDLAQGVGKTPLATVKGTYAGRSISESEKWDIFNPKKWVEVGFDPIRSSQFIDVRTGDVVTGGSEAIHIGSRVFVKNDSALKSKKAPKGRYSKTEQYAFDPVADQEYMAAVEAGDTKGAQLLVDKAAKAAGYNQLAFHGKGGMKRLIKDSPIEGDFLRDDAAPDFSVFDLSLNSQGAAVFSESKSVSLGFTERTSNHRRSPSDVLKVALNTKGFFDFRKPADVSDLIGAINAHPDIVAPRGKRVKGGGAGSLHMKAKAVREEYTLGQLLELRRDPEYKTIRKWMESGDYAVIETRGMSDLLKGIGYKGAIARESGALSFFAFDPNQIKSADPITKDADGNVIPLSKRFDPSSDSIQYAFDPRRNPSPFEYEPRPTSESNLPSPMADVTMPDGTINPEAPIVIWDRVSKKAVSVSTYKNIKRARTRADKLNDNYGGHRYSAEIWDGSRVDTQQHAFDPMAGANPETGGMVNASDEQMDHVRGGSLWGGGEFGSWGDRFKRFMTGGYLSVVDTLEDVGFKGLADRIYTYQIRVGEVQGKLMEPFRRWRKGKTLAEINKAYEEAGEFFRLREDYGSHPAIHKMINMLEKEKAKQKRIPSDERDFTVLNDMEEQLSSSLRAMASKARKDAEAYRNKMAGDSKTLLAIIEDTADKTGEISDELGIMVEEGGRWRRMRNLGRLHYPRGFSSKVMEVIQSPRLDPNLYSQLIRALRRDGVVESDREGEEYLRSLVSYSEMQGGEYFANVEKARGLRLPAEFYETSVDNYLQFLNRFADRAAQIHAFGQTTDVDSDAFGAAIKSTPNKEMREYLQAVANDVYRRKQIRTGTDKLFERMVSVTGIVYLSGPFTAIRDFVSGVMLTAEQYGLGATVPPTLRAFADAARAVAQTAKNFAKKDYQTVTPELTMEAEAFGAIRENFLQAQLLDQRLDPDNKVDQRLVGVGEKALFFKQSMDRLARGVTMGASLNWLTAASNIYQSDPTSSASKKRIAALKRLRFSEAEAIQLLNGNAALMEEFARRSVAEKQYTYSLAQHPLFIGSHGPVMKLMFQFQRWTFQRGRDLIRNVVMPAMKGTDVQGERVREIMPLMRFAASGIIFGELLRKLMALFTDKEDARGASLEEIMRSDSGWPQLRKALHRAKDDFVFTGATGFLGDYGMMLYEHTGIDRGPRWKDPFRPPLFNLLQDTISAGTSFVQKGATLTALHQELAAAGRGLPALKQAEGLIRGTNRKIGSPFPWGADKWEARRDLFYVRNMARRFGKEEGMDVESKFYGTFAADEHTAHKIKLKEALMIGDYETAKEVRNELLDAGMTKRGIASSIRSGQPVRVGMQTRDDVQRDFRKWMKKHVPSELDRVERVQSRYTKTARLLGFLK